MSTSLKVYSDIASILFDVKEKLDDNEYLELSNLLLKANNKFREYRQIYGDVERLINIRVCLNCKIDILRNELEDLTRQMKQKSDNSDRIICECGCSLKKTSMKTHRTSMKHRRYVAIMRSQT